MILDEICEYKRGVVAAARKARPLSAVREEAAQAPPPRGFRDALRAPGISLIAEVKRHSPVKGDFLPDVEAHALASLYERSGARAISVLTDENYFKGSLQDLRDVRVHVGVPVLRKEFIIDEYQIFEARAAGADAILLIVRCLSAHQLRDFLAVARHCHLDVLVETHTAAEVEQALEADAHIIGINNRDLDTFTVRLETTLELKRLVPGGKVLVSESGIHSAADVRRLEEGGVDAILVGEAIVTSDNIPGTVRELAGGDAR
jgi:indole-3-glycerol phosphate synthase